MNIDWKFEYLKLKEHAIALEHAKADLWGVNQELRERIESLEKGQEDLLVKLRNDPPQDLL